MSIDAIVTGDREVIAKFGRVTPAVREEVTKAITRLTFQIMRKAVQDKLSGQVLKRQTGTLARAVTQSPRTFAVGPNIVGSVGVADITGKGGRAPVKYGRAHEFGFSGTVTVKQHLRQIKQAFGKPLKAQVQATVRAHAARLSIPKRPFLKPSLDEIQTSGKVEAEISAAIRAGVDAAQ